MYNTKYNRDVDALNPYKDCELECTDSGEIHCHWSIRGGNIYRSDVNHEWIKDKCNYDLCICMLECISNNSRIATELEAEQYCYNRRQKKLWVTDGKEGDIFDYDFWKEEYLKQEKVK